MNYIFNQPRGLGDILFIMKIAQEEVAKGNRVIIPVDSHYTDIQKHFPEVKIIDRKSFNLNHEIQHVYNIDEYSVIPFRFANDILRVPYTDCMKAKYWYWDLLKNGVWTNIMSDGNSWKRWRDFTYIRDLENEKKLFDYLNPKGLPYNFINRNFRTNFSGKSPIKVDNGLLNIEMRYLKGFTLLDWGIILERAENIHTVGTSINYLIEKLDIKAPINLYVRKPEEKDFKNYDYILDTENKNYIFHL